MNNCKIEHIYQWLKLSPFAFKHYYYNAISKSFINVYWNFYENVIKGFCLPNENLDDISNKLDNHETLQFAFILPEISYERYLYDLAIKKIKLLLSFYDLRDCLVYKPRYLTEFMKYADNSNNTDYFDMFYKYDKTYRYEFGKLENEYEKVNIRYCVVSIFLSYKYDTDFLRSVPQAQFINEEENNVY